MNRQTARFTTELAEYRYDDKEVFKRSGKLKRSFYETELLRLHHELVKLQKWTIDNRKRILIIFEGMDTAGKSSTIKVAMTYLNPRQARAVALPKPDSKELGQWYFQRHLKQLPNASEMVFFDRSWYNRAGIEMVFGFCTSQQHEHFYLQVNDLEKMLIDDGIYLFKFYLNIDYETQEKRLRQRERDPLKNWKLSELDYKSHEAYPVYARLRDKMFRLSGSIHAPWCELDANDKKRARLNAIRYLLDNIDYEGKDTTLITGVDKKIVTLHQHEIIKKESL